PDYSVFSASACALLLALHEWRATRLRENAPVDSVRGKGASGQAGATLWLPSPEKSYDVGAASVRLPERPRRFHHLITSIAAAIAAPNTGFGGGGGIDGSGVTACGSSESCRARNARSARAPSTRLPSAFFCP